MKAPPTITVLVDACIFGLLPGGGIGRYFREIWSRVPARHPDIRFILMWPHGAGEAPVTPGVSVVRAPFQFRPGRLFSQWNNALYQRAIRQAGADVYHSTYYTPCPVPELPTVVTAHDMLDEHFFDGFSGNPRSFRLHLRQALSSANHVIAVSNTTRDDVMRFAGVHADGVTVCPHGVSAAFQGKITDGMLGHFRSRHRLDRPYLIYVGRQNHYKNFATLLEGWRLARTRGLDVQLLCLGENSALAQHHADFLTRHRLLADFRSLEHLTDEELATAYAGASAFVFPSLWEGFGLPALEAAATTPLVLSDIPAFREVAGDAALFFDPLSPEDLAGALVKASHPDTAMQLRAKARGLSARYSWDESADLHAAVYRKIARSL